MLPTVVPLMVRLSRDGRTTVISSPELP
jgi:hypothetical protein